MSVVEVLGGKRKQGRGPLLVRALFFSGKSVDQPAWSRMQCKPGLHALGGSSDGISGMPGTSGSARIGSVSAPSNPGGKSRAALGSAVVSGRGENTSSSSNREKSVGSKSARSPNVVTGGGIAGGHMRSAMTYP